MGDRTNEWRVGCCSCLSHLPSCMDHFCCYPCAASRVCMVAQTPAEPQTCSILHCICATQFHQIYACKTRLVLAERYKIDEGCLMSTIIGCFFPCCSMIQVHREAGVHNEWPGGSCFETEAWPGVNGQP